MRKLVMVLCLLLLTGFAYAQTETIYEEPMSATDVVSSGPAERIENLDFTDQDIVFIVITAFLILGVVFTAWFLPSIVCGFAARSKGRSFMAFFIFSLIATPIFGFLAVIAFKDNVNKKIMEEARKQLEQEAEEFFANHDDIEDDKFDEEDFKL